MMLERGLNIITAQETRCRCFHFARSAGLSSARIAVSEYPAESPTRKPRAFNDMFEGLAQHTTIDWDQACDAYAAESHALSERT